MTFKRPKPVPSEIGRRRPAGSPTDKRPQAFSYHANRSASREIATQRELARVSLPSRPQASWRWWLTLAGLLVLFIAVSVQSTAPAIAVAGSDDSRQLLQPPAVYQAAAQKLLDSPLNHIKYLTDTAALTAQLKQQFPELTAVVVTESLLVSHPTITVTSYEPALVVNGADGSYAVDELGISRVASARLPSALRDKLPMVADQSGLSLEPGQAVLPVDDVAFIQTVLAGLKAANVGFDQLTLPAVSSELDVKISGQSYFVKFALRGGADARQQLGTFLAAQSQVGGAGYVDVRVPERLYYK